MIWEMVDGDIPKWAIGSWYWTRLHFPPKFSKVCLVFKLGQLIAHAYACLILEIYIGSHAYDSLVLKRLKMVGALDVAASSAK